MKIGYSFWGFLGDRKVGPQGVELSTPDGNATYSWSIVWEAMKRNHVVVPLQEERDKHGIDLYGDKLFRAFSTQKRSDVYTHLCRSGHGWNDGSHEKFPELDVILVEWRFPIAGRNTSDSKGTVWYQRDLERQNEILDYYSDKDTKIFIWDLDHKIELEDELKFNKNITILETSIRPRKLHLERTTVEPPFIIEDLLQHRTLDSSRVHVSYIGSRYERDIIIDDWISAYAKRYPGTVHFHGKWEPIEELRTRWSGIVFHDRIGVSGFRNAYKSAGCVPLLAKQSYRESGFMTPRPVEAVLFGSIPIGLGGHLGVEDYCFETPELPSDFEECVQSLASMSIKTRDIIRHEMRDQLSFMDAKYFVDVLEGK